MVVIILAWGSIFLIFLTFGDFLINIYNRITKRTEYYDLPKTFILGMSFTLIPLSLLSFWLPSNHIVMFSFSFLSFIYLFFYRNKLKNKTQRIYKKINLFNIFQRFLLFSPFLILIICALWQQYNSDAPGYHYQLTHWNESYPVIPGITNLEDRMGFNSNYSLISAIFTFRFLAHEQHFLIQSLLTAIIFSQIIYGIINENNNKTYIATLIIFLFFCWTNYPSLTNSSTDIIPALVIFYFLTQLILKPNSINQEYLFLVFIPISLITFKLSTFPLVLLSTFVLYKILKNKDYKVISFLLILSIFIITPWFIRNSIISGYLVYPICQIDLFDFDWKVPKYVALQQKSWIFDYPRIAINENYNFLLSFFQNGGVAHEKSRFIILIIEISVCLSVSVLFIIALFKVLKKQTVHPTYRLILLFSSIYILYWMLTAPDFRFISGLLYALLLLAYIFYTNKQEIKLDKYINIYIIVALSSLLLISSKEIYNGYRRIVNTGTINKRPLSYLLFAPYTIEAERKSLTFTKYPMGNIMINIPSDKYGFTYDRIPASGQKNEYKYQPIENVEARGKNISDGFRPKKQIRIDQRE